MKKNTVKFFKIVALLLPLLAVSCTDNSDDIFSPEQYKEQFLGYTDYGIYIEGVPEFKFDKTIHQIYHSGDKLKFYLSDDLATSYMKLNMLTSPDNGGIIESAIYLTDKEVIPANLKVIKEEGTMYWLWSDEEVMGILIMQ